jgi:hypothetical protein
MVRSELYPKKHDQNCYLDLRENCATTPCFHAWSHHSQDTIGRKVRWAYLQDRNILAAHYKAKARTARYLIIAIEDMTGQLTPKELTAVCGI